MNKETNKSYYLNDNQEFVVENYHTKRAFANFFPGIAGTQGVPMWVFYVNRGQAISSFGTQNKDQAIVEFYPANKAWELVSLYGFRTFLKITSAHKVIRYEPFDHDAELAANVTTRMAISASELTIEETNTALNLKTKISYFTIPQASFPALVRSITFENLSNKTLAIEMLDGLPHINPYGTNNYFLKEMSRTIEAWMVVENIKNNAPFFKLHVDPSDKPEVIHIQEGNFFVSFAQNNPKKTLLPIIVNPEVIFGTCLDFKSPQNFYSTTQKLDELNTAITSKSPCAFSLSRFELKAKDRHTTHTLIGNMRSLKMLNSMLPKITQTSYIDEKRAENSELIKSLQLDSHTNSSNQTLNLYIQQNYLDNIVRGGYPYKLSSKGTDSIFYVYSRKHGDLERDYNRFHIQNTYFSQGNGNFRDINQNRRCDIWFNPAIKTENLTFFFNLIQSDGYNPLIVKGATFGIQNPEEIELKLGACFQKPADCKTIANFLKNPFTPGDVLMFLENNAIKLTVSIPDFLNELFGLTSKYKEAEHGEGFWIDHWHYNLDLLESYLGLFPEEKDTLFFNSRIFTFFDNNHYVKPRSQKYLIYHDGTIKQLHSVGVDKSKAALINSRSEQAHVSRSNYGKGTIYETTLLNKCLCLVLNKSCSLDPEGCGIEMEADKPNWYDALNGLPALFGSSVCETLELKRLLHLLIEQITSSSSSSFEVTREIKTGIEELAVCLKTWKLSTNTDKDFLYWKTSEHIKETYREKTLLGFNGEEIRTDKNTLLEYLNLILEKVNHGIDKSKSGSLYTSYFFYTAQEFAVINHPYVEVTKFLQHKVPLFLEGQMHALRLAQTNSDALKIHTATRKSSLFDSKLKMYKVTSSLNKMPAEIGRCRAFAPGWLENESIWLHMEYKYLLELLKNNLCDEFYQDFKNCLVPFLKPKTYGRSTLENSSFIVSSAFSDKRLHGAGFVARLSGSTAEFINIWLIMNIGTRPFTYKNNKLSLTLAPVLAGWLFDKTATYSFKFLRTTTITYVNKKRLNTYGKNKVAIKHISISNDSQHFDFQGDTIPAPYAQQVRSGEFSHIIAHLD